MSPPWLVLSVSLPVRAPTEARLMKFGHSDLSHSSKIPRDEAHRPAIGQHSLRGLHFFPK